ncbi:PiggyBac transposable element-derived protein like [Argiope bruennichi]|uniref:PiggyBac transposable element-derived protein like n=1 Tax=Argiope bruennichi TaxID=94029 RepID=A0A8T0E977_ARGBR|nr:PiggyBac transposable element-derived protein like [Argiope bruennichi]
MGGIDKADMLRAIYDRDRKSKKWWHRLFLAMLEMAYINSYIAYVEVRREKMSSVDYKRCITKGLLTKSKLQPKRKGRPKSNGGEQTFCAKKRIKGNLSVSNDVCLENRGYHWPTFVSSRGRCEFSALKNIQSKPRSKCSTCNIFLCVNEKENCFYDYHQM